MKIESEEDFKKFYEQHAPKVRGVLFRLVGEQALSDLTQETFLKVWMHRKKFRSESDISTWVYRISYNCAMDYLRKNRNREIPTDADASQSLEKDLSDREVVDLLLKALEIEHRIVVLLFYIEDLGIKEIAASLEIPEGTVKSRLSYARSYMTDFLQKKGVRL